MSRWIGLKIGNRFNRSVEMRMVLPFWHYFSRRSNFLDNRDTSAKQLRANWSMGRTKEIFCKSLKNKWKGHPGAPPTTRIAGIVSFGIKFSVSKPPSCWIFFFFLEMDPGETTNRTNGLHSLLRRANRLYYRIMTKYGGVRWIFLHLGTIFLNIFFTLLLACLSGFGHRDIGFKPIENTSRSSSHTT